MRAILNLVIQALVLSTITLLCGLCMFRLRPLAMLWLYPKAARQGAPVLNDRDRIIARIVQAGYALLLLGYPAITVLALPADSLTLFSAGLRIFFQLFTVNFCVLFASLLLFCSLQPRFLLLPGVDPQILSRPTPYVLRFELWILVALVASAALALLLWAVV